MKCCRKATLLALLCLPTTLIASEPKISVAFPAAGASVATERQTYVIGSVTPPDAPLSINGKNITPWRTGSFLYMAPVVPGTNTLVLRAGKTALSHTFTVPFPAPTWNGKGLFVQQPLQPLGIYTGETVRLACFAPTGLTVCACVGERSVRLAPQGGTPTLYKGTVSFDSPAEKVPVVFYAQGLADAAAAELTVRSEWATHKITGPLFETRARSEPGDGDTVAFLFPGFRVQAAGFEGNKTRFWLNNKLCYTDTRFLASDPTSPLPPRDATPPDLAAGFGPHPPTNRTPSQILVVLDPGHGGPSTGAIGPSGITEKQINLQQAKTVKAVLEQAGFRVHLTRESDVDIGLYERALLAYREKADAFISIHHNATAAQTDPQAARHVSTYAWNDIGRQLARALHPHISAVTPIADRGVMTASFAVCRNPAIPSCLLELDFINCPEGEESIQRPGQQRRVADAILAGLRDWLALSVP